MAKLAGKGIPTRKTLGAIGDIYTDTTTGKHYECTFAYRDNAYANFDCQWKETSVSKKVEQPKEEPVTEETPEDISNEFTETTEEVNEEAEVNKEEVKEDNKKFNNNRTKMNYSSLYGKKNK